MNSTNAWPVESDFSEDDGDQSFLDQLTEQFGENVYLPPELALSFSESASEPSDTDTDNEAEELNIFYDLLKVLEDFHHWVSPTSISHRTLDIKSSSNQAQHNLKHFEVIGYLLQYSVKLSIFRFSVEKCRFAAFEASPPFWSFVGFFFLNQFFL
jgi:hypothetical protein